MRIILPVFTDIYVLAYHMKILKYLLNKTFFLAFYINQHGFASQIRSKKKGGVKSVISYICIASIFYSKYMFFAIKTMLLFCNLLTNNKHYVIFIGKVVSKKIKVFHVNLTKTWRLNIVSYFTTSNTSFALDCCIVLQNDHLMDWNVQ